MTFRGEILAGGGGGHAVVIPAEVAAALSRKNAQVLAVVNGVEYPTRVARYGGRSYLGLRKELLRSIGADTGDTVEIELTEQLEPERAPEPEPEEAAELTAALDADPACRARFDALPAEHRREYLRWIATADQPATRAERASKLVRRLSSG